MYSVAARASVAVKIAALLLLAVAVVHPDMGGLKSKGLGVRAVVYPLGLVALPLLCLGLRRWMPALRLSWPADLLCSLPVLVDLVGNRANLFDTVAWWDDAAHLLMHGVLTAGVLVQFRPRARAVEYIVTAVAFGGVSGLVWELGEYLAFMRFGVELTGAYLDTLGDLSGGMAGSMLAGTAAAVRRRRAVNPASSRPADPASAAVLLLPTSASPGQH
jgi:hypothetical protein